MAITLSLVENSHLIESSHLLIIIGDVLEICYLEFKYKKAYCILFLLNFTMPKYTLSAT